MTSADGFNPARPDGRWARILRAAIPGPIATGDLHRAVRRHGETRTWRLEKLKTMRSLRQLTRHSLLAHTPEGFITTGAGMSAIAGLTTITDTPERTAA